MDWGKCLPMKDVYHKVGPTFLMPQKKGSCEESFFGKMYYIQFFDNFRAKKRFQRLDNMSYGLGHVFAHERCLSQSWTNFPYASEKGKL